MLRLWILPFLGLIAVFGFACGNSGDSPPPSSASIAPTTMATASLTTPPSPTPTLAATLTYSDPTSTYSFDYPASWRLSPAKDNGGDVILYSYDLASVPSGEAGMPVPKDKLKAIIYVAEGVDKPVREWLSETRNGPGQPPAPTTVSSSDVTLGGKPGVAEVVDDGGNKIAGYYIEMGAGRLLVIGAGPADSEVWPEFETVLASVKFTQ